MNNNDFNFIKKYEELLDKGYCDCNEMNCIDNNSPRRILNIVKDLQQQLKAYENMRKEAIKLIEDNWITYEDSKQFIDFNESLPVFIKEINDLLKILNKVGGEK